MKVAAFDVTRVVGVQAAIVRAGTKNWFCVKPAATFGTHIKGIAFGAGKSIACAGTGRETGERDLRGLIPCPHGVASGLFLKGFSARKGGNAAATVRIHKPRNASRAVMEGEQKKRPHCSSPSFSARLRCYHNAFCHSIERAPWARRAR